MIKMKFANLQLDKHDHIGLVTIDHPPANTWNLATVQEFRAAIEELIGDRETRVVVITGGGEKCFSAGLDVSDTDNIAKISPLARELWRRIDTMDKPTIAAINGHALGGGLELAMSCHFRVAADKPGIKLGLTELNLGIIPGWGGTQRLPRLVGRANALEMILFSKVLDPRQALEAGLVDRLSPPDSLLPDALELARKLAQRPPIAVSWVLKAMNAGIYQGIDEGLRMEEQGSAAVRASQDRVEGFRAFLEKREPVFKGE